MKFVNPIFPFPFPVPYSDCGFEKSRFSKTKTEIKIQSKNGAEKKTWWMNGNVDGHGMTKNILLVKKRILCEQ